MAEGGNAVYARYLCHGRKYGVDNAFWKTASSDGLSQHEMRRLARELGVKLPSKWSLSRNGTPEATSHAGLTANKSQTGPAGPSRRLLAVESGERGSCAGCEVALGAMNTSGLCRRCYQRELMRDRRRKSPPEGVETAIPPVEEWSR